MLAVPSCHKSAPENEQNLVKSDKKFLISTFACFLTAIAKVLFPEGILRTRLCPRPNLRFF